MQLGAVNRLRSIDTGCIKLTVIYANGFYRPALMLTIVTVVADDFLYLLRSLRLS
jgi:hypothetical protein